MATILVLSDECSIQEVLRHIFVESGHTVVAGPLSCQTKHADPSLSPQLVLLDLPSFARQEDGTIPALRRQYPSAKVVAMFNGGYADSTLLARKWNVDGCLFKPFDLDTLLVTVATVCHWQFYIPYEPAI